MSFLDNLENNLKNLESREEGGGAAEQQRQRERARAAALAAAPYAEELKKGPFTAELLKQAARVGFEKRTKVHVAWLGSTLRLEVRERRLELRPGENGVQAVYLEDGRETRSEPLDLASSAEELVRRWLS
ncbi:MAG TPA: hypothetical protein VKX45_08125 [Bryobacteraceae bacterium]|jgi:hypothetical protein|nr:hypothetical protein [Bryobacteraceae bacterium]